MFEQSSKSNRGILLGQDNNALVYLVAINLLVFVLLTFIKIIFYLSEIPIEQFYNQIFNWFILPASKASFFGKPWVLFTYMFTNESIWGLISTILWLWAFGFILQDLTGNNKLIPIYLYGGVTGGICYLLVSNLFPVFSNHISNITDLQGASAAVIAIAVATTTLAPNYRIFPLINGGIPLWVLLLIYLLIDFSTMASIHASIAVSHFAGGLIGFFYIKQLRNGKDWGEWMNNFFQWLNNLLNPENKSIHNNQQTRNNTNKNHLKKSKASSEIQEKIDTLLDKINKEGYQSLSDTEKSFLKNASKE